MAAIEKIYLAKDDAINFYHYMKSIDSEFVETFPNTKTIFDFLYIENCEDIEAIEGETKTFPVSHFPQVVDAWLLRRKDLPDFIKQEIYQQYGMTSSDHPMLTTPLYFRTCMSGEIGTKLKLIKRCGDCVKRNYSKFGYAVEVVSPEYVWYDEFLDYWEDDAAYNKYSVSPGWVSSTANTKHKSLKSIIRKLRKWKFAKGTIIKVMDFNFDGEFLFKVL